MPCFYPLEAFRSRHIDLETGKRSIIFNRLDAMKSTLGYDPIKLPCGRCIGCRLDRSRQWAVRCCHEASLFEKNSFITLTFNEEFCPDTINVRDIQLFMKRLRKKFKGFEMVPSLDAEGNPIETLPIRFYGCGEYGEVCSNCGKSKFYCECGNFYKSIGRPHYHLCLFNFNFDDLELFKITDAGSRIYRSAALEQLWPFGFASVGELTFESAAYTARYIMKKINGDMAEAYYNDIDPETGEYLVERTPEFTVMSRKPGIAARWLDKYGDDTYRDDYVVVNGVKMKPPKYYDVRREFTNPEDMDEIKDKRQLRAMKSVDNNTPDRLEIREQVLKSKLQSLQRNL